MRVRAVLVCCGLMVAVPALAQQKPYAMADLEALQKNEGWVELVEHLGDIPPGQRDAKWDAMAGQGAVGWLGTLQDPVAALHGAEDLAKRFPQLKKHKGFMEKRAEVGLKGYESCYQNRWDNDCNARFLTFVGDDKALAFKAGKIVVRNQHHYYAAPFFKKATTGLKAGSPECKDEALQRATLAALGVPTDDPKAEAGRAVAEICLADLKDQIVDELAEGSSYTMANACPVMLKGKAVTGLMQKRCEAAATAKK